jgi:hypothetical protein
MDKSLQPIKETLCGYDLYIDAEPQTAEVVGKCLKGCIDKLEALYKENARLKTEISNKESQAMRRRNPLHWLGF